MQVFQNLANNIQFSASRAVNYRTAVVYANLTDEEALQIGRSHNEMTGTNLPPKFRDDVNFGAKSIARLWYCREMQNAAHNERFLTSLKQVFGVNVS